MGVHTGEVYDLDFLSVQGYVQVAISGAAEPFQTKHCRLQSLLQMAFMIGATTRVSYVDGGSIGELESATVEILPAPTGTDYVTMLSFDVNTRQCLTNVSGKPPGLIVPDCQAQGILETAMRQGISVPYLDLDDQKKIIRVKVNTALRP